ncbi:hypothetical protein QBC35DRAFT_466167 [Podospora australis]|uniref:Ecp2 effector protein-like domain-containing protein n=1 Tax=Podospora australis TaxID=1536484 RepID=A0AAN6WMR5_9PEZI|nr:hypothetical protein QBC35DRAFT_466167 [Podospora australis]
MFPTSAFLALAGLLAVTHAAPTVPKDGFEIIHTINGPKEMPIGSVIWNNDPYVYCANNTKSSVTGGLSTLFQKCNQQTTKESQVSRASPWAKDCITMVDILSVHGAAWTILQAESRRRIADYKTCAFGVDVHNGGMAYVGDGDLWYIMYNLQGCAHQFPGETERRAGYKGTMWCNHKRSSLGENLSHSIGVRFRRLGSLQIVSSIENQ